MEVALIISINYLQLPRPGPKEIEMLYDGIAGLDYTESQVRIAYDTHRRDIGHELLKLRNSDDTEGRQRPRAEREDLGGRIQSFEVDIRRARPFHRYRHRHFRPCRL
jgi:hypothetical protein